jgi:general secretion pathway protein K
VALSISTSVRSETDRVSSSADGLRASYLASGALERAILWLQWGNDGVAAVNPDGSPRFWQRTMSRLTMAFPSGDAVVEVIPEASKLGINSASADDLYRVVFTVSGDPERARLITDGILDWRAASTGPTAFDQYYFTLSPTFRARHASFQEIEELLLVRGMSPELFYGNYTTGTDGRLYARGGLRDCLSVWGSNGPFDVNTSSPALLEAMGTPADVVATMVSRRQVRPFANMREVAELGELPPRVSMNPGQSIYTVRATARLRMTGGGYSDVVRIAAATIRLPGPRPIPKPPVQVLRWYDDAWSQAAIPPFDGMVVSGGNVPGQPGFAGSMNPQGALQP